MVYGLKLSKLYISSVHIDGLGGITCLNDTLPSSDNTTDNSKKKLDKMYKFCKIELKIEKGIGKISYFLKKDNNI